MFEQFFSIFCNVWSLDNSLYVHPKHNCILNSYTMPLTQHGLLPPLSALYANYRNLWQIIKALKVPAWLNGALYSYKWFFSLTYLLVIVLRSTYPTLAGRGPLLEKSLGQISHPLQRTIGNCGIILHTCINLCPNDSTVSFQCNNNHPLYYDIAFYQHQ
jgi:hypothetical protein